MADNGFHNPFAALYQEDQDLERKRAAAKRKRDQLLAEQKELERQEAEIAQREVQRAQKKRHAQGQIFDFLCAVSHQYENFFLHNVVGVGFNALAGFQYFPGMIVHFMRYQAKGYHPALPLVYVALPPDSPTDPDDSFSVVIEHAGTVETCSPPEVQDFYHRWVAGLMRVAPDPSNSALLTEFRSIPPQGNSWNLVNYQGSVGKFLCSTNTSQRCRAAQQWAWFKVAGVKYALTLHFTEKDDHKLEITVPPPCTNAQLSLVSSKSATDAFQRSFDRYIAENIADWNQLNNVFEDAKPIENIPQNSSSTGNNKSRKKQKRNTS